MAAGAVLHVDDIEPRVEVCRHPAVQEVDDYLSRRCRLDVEAADGGGRIDDHQRKAAMEEGLRLPLRQKLAPLVMADHVGEGHGSRFGTRLAIPRIAEGADTTGVDHAGDAAFERGVENVARAADVYVVHHLGRAGPEPIVGSRVVQHLAPFEAFFQ